MCVQTDDGQVAARSKVATWSIPSRVPKATSKGSPGPDRRSAPLVGARRTADAGSTANRVTASPFGRAHLRGRGEHRMLRPHPPGRGEHKKVDVVKTLVMVLPPRTRGAPPALRAAVAADVAVHGSPRGVGGHRSDGTAPFATQGSPRGRG